MSHSWFCAAREYTSSVLHESRTTKYVHLLFVYCVSSTHISFSVTQWVIFVFVLCKHTCHVCMSHREWDMCTYFPDMQIDLSRMNEACDMWMSHIICEWAPKTSTSVTWLIHPCVGSFAKKPYTAMALLHMPKTCSTSTLATWLIREWVLSHVWMSHVTRDVTCVF